MNQIRKHTFEAISLLTASNGLLDVTIVPAVNQPDWIIPTDLILSVDEYAEWIWTYLWQQQEVAVFHLLPREQTPDKLIVLEGNTTVHRLALQTAGELRQLKVRISDVKDTELPAHYIQMTNSQTDDNFNINNAVENQSNNANNESSHQELDNIRFQENAISSYLFQAVTIDDIYYSVPDLEKIAHQLVDLDS